MDLSLGVPSTLAITALVLIVGRHLVERIEFLRRYAIPEPVAGSLVAAVLVAGLHAIGLRIAFDTSLRRGSCAMARRHRRSFSSPSWAHF